jgi:hypothetical protein
LGEKATHVRYAVQHLITFIVNTIAETAMPLFVTAVPLRKSVPMGF